MTLSLDETRLREIKSMLIDWQSKTHATKRELQIIIGILSFASKAVVLGRTFLRRMIDAMKAIPFSYDPDQRIALTEQFFQDLQWWHRFIDAWNITCAGKRVTDACQTGYSGVSSEGFYAHR